MRTSTGPQEGMVYNAAADEPPMKSSIGHDDEPCSARDSFTAVRAPGRSVAAITAQRV